MQLNEDFFDDNDITVNPSEYMDGEQEELVYEYHFQFIITTWAFISNESVSQDTKNTISNKPVSQDTKIPYYFYDSKLKPVIESTFIAMKNALEYILKYSPVVTGYSPVRLCSQNLSVTETYPYMDNKPTFEYSLPIYKRAVLLETAVNLSEKKNIRKLKKLFYSFYRLQKIFDNLIVNVIKLKWFNSAPNIEFGVFMENPYKKTKPCNLLMPTDDFNSDTQEMINTLNYKHETE